MFKKLRILTAGESHGKGLIGIIEGMPARLELTESIINADLKRRQGGYGRGGRMKIEEDKIEILSGVRWGFTLGTPISLLITNKDWVNWQKGMSIHKSDKDTIPLVTRPRPGHADLAGVIKYGHEDARNVLERSSARETAIKVALGAIAKCFLSMFDIKIYSFVLSIGNITLNEDFLYEGETNFKEFFDKAEQSIVRCPDELLSNQMKEVIDIASSNGDTLGGVFAVVVDGVPMGLGNYINWDLRLDARLSYAIMGIQAIKAVEIGKGLKMAQSKGSDVMDEIFYSRDRFFYRNTNNAGGIEGGMSNGMPVVIKAAMKPIPTLKKPLSSVDFKTKEALKAAYERSDICAVPAASVIAEAMTSLVITDAFLEKFGGDSIEEIKSNYNSYIRNINSGD